MKSELWEMFARHDTIFGVKTFTFRKFRALNVILKYFEQQMVSVQHEIMTAP